MNDPNENRPGYKQTKVGWIPSQWEAPLLSAITKHGKPIVYGIVQAGPDTSGGVPYIRSTDVGKRFVSDVSLLRTDPQIALKYKRAAVAPGDVVFSLRGNIGETSLVPRSLDGANLTQGTARIAVASGAVPAFVHYSLKTHSVRRLIDAWAKGSTFREITIEDLRKVPIPLPPLPEQQKIAKILSTWDNAIAQVGALIESKRQQKKALMQQLLAGRRRLPGFKGVWVPKRLGDVFTERRETGGDHLPLLAITRDRGIIPASDIDRKDASNENKSQYKIIRIGDIGYNTMRMWQGVNALSSLEGIVSPAYTIAIPKSRLFGPFIAHYFKFQPVVHLFFRYSQGLVSDTWNLKFHHFAEIVLSFPEVAEQRAIAIVLDTADKEITSLEAKLEAFRQQKKGLMQRLLTGQVRVEV